MYKIYFISSNSLYLENFFFLAVLASSKLVESINESSNLTVDIGDQFLDLTFRIQELYGLCVGVIADTKRPWDCCSKITKNNDMNFKMKLGTSYSHHLLLSTLKAFRNEIYRLMLCDWVLL